MGTENRNVCLEERIYLFGITKDERVPPDSPQSLLLSLLGKIQTYNTLDTLWGKKLSHLQVQSRQT